MEENKIQTSISFEPFFDKVVVRRDPEETKSAGGINLSGNAKLAAQKGTVVAHGPDMRFVKLGMRVAFPTDAGVDIIVDGEEFALMVERTLWGEGKSE